MTLLITLLIRLHWNCKNSQYKITTDVFQITYFCTKHLIFWVQKCTKCVHIEKYVKLQCTTRTIKTLKNWLWNNGQLTPFNERHIGDVAQGFSIFQPATPKIMEPETGDTRRGDITLCTAWQTHYWAYANTGNNTTQKNNSLTAMM